ncbi:MAG TPA: beta-propeller domain-containing protein, partial [Polyangiaceae bacterium]|nr:beta-propeller domain-containing protein [Polyangiaceae bacterium]
MRHLRIERWVVATFVTAASACAGVAPRAPAPSQDAATPAAPALISQPTAAPEARREKSSAVAPVGASAGLPPPPSVKLPLAGEAAAATLAEARLVPSDCDALEGATRRLAEQRVHAMQEAVDEEYRQWAAEQPECWRTFRELGESFGSGGLGLSGIGEGGGGLGLGSSQGYGAGDGRLSGSHKTSSPRRATSASGTNNQVASVDEADIVKNDGRYVYVVMNGALRIIEALDPKVVSVTRLRGSVKELFVEGERAVVYTSEGGNGRRACTYGYDCSFAGDGSATRVLVLDISNRAAPRLVRTLELSGSLLAARRVGRVIHTVVSEGDTDTPEYETWPANLDRCGVKEAYVRKRLAELKRDNAAKIRASRWFPTLREGKNERVLCERALATAIDDGDAYTTLVSFDMADDGTPPASVTLRSRPGAIFASQSALYVATTHERAGRRATARHRAWYSFYRSVDEVTDIHEFRLGEHPSDTGYIGSGVVPGHVLNQFAMDEYSGYLRVATTRGRVPNPNVASAVSVLAQSPEGNLVRVGAIENIAPGEDIRAVRFDEERGYVVTFKKTDPLFVLDLYRPDQPKILGALAIPGFSTYLHRIDPNHLLAIGFDANDHGSFAYFDGVILQLFDVKNPTDPRLIHKEKIGSRGSSSE